MDIVSLIIQYSKFTKMQKQPRGYERETYSTSIKMVESMHNLSKSFFPKTISSICSNVKVGTLLPTSKPVKYIKNKPNKPIFCPKRL